MFPLPSIRSPLHLHLLYSPPSFLNSSATSQSSQVSHPLRLFFFTKLLKNTIKTTIFLLQIKGINLKPTMALAMPRPPNLGFRDSSSLKNSTPKPTTRFYTKRPNHRSPTRIPCTQMLTNGYVGGFSSKNVDKIYRRMGSCLIIPPPSGRKPLAIIKFLGGAFIGAIPEVTYNHLMEMLAKEGFLIVSVPYNVTFDHTKAAREVYERFHACMDMLLTSGLPYPNLGAAEIACLPRYSVGHSNGALLQLLVGSYFSEKIPEANAIISFNNKPAAEAVPYFEQLGPMVSQVMPIMETSPMYSMARNASGDAWKALQEAAGMLVQNYDQEAMVSLNKFVDQLPSVMNQVTQGTSEFKPTPSENRDFFNKSYNVPHTLLVKFSTDPIDETDLLEEILRPRVEHIGGTLEKVTLSGNHLTPCLQDLKWQVGSQYTPADALAQGLKSLSLNDTRVLARTIADWLKGLNQEQ